MNRHIDATAGLVASGDAYPLPVKQKGGSEVHKNAPRAAQLANGVVTVWTPAAGRRVRALWFSVTTSGATVLTVKLGAAVLWERDFAGADGADVLLPLDGVLGAADEALTVTTTAAVTVGASAEGREE